MSRLLKIVAVVALLGVLPAVGAAQAADWVATRLRGVVFVQEGDGWAQLSRGDTVANGLFVRTGEHSRVVLEREFAQISVSDNSRIMIDERADGYTTLYQDVGTVRFDVTTRGAPFFEVRTRQLAAVVKGTRFVVTALESMSSVAVHRGLVEVRDPVRNSHVNLGPGQAAEMRGENAMLSISGRGSLAQVEPMPQPAGAGQGNGPGNGQGQGNGEGQGNGQGQGVGQGSGHGNGLIGSILDLIL